MPPKKRVKVEEDLVGKVWDHYCSFLDSCDDDGEGDIDELLEIVQLLHTITPTLSIGTTRQALLPIVASMAHYQLASDLMAQSIDMGKDGDDNDGAILNHLQKSIHFFPLNCSTWSIGANYARIQNAVSHSTIVQWYQKAAIYASSLRTQTLELLEQEQLNGDDNDDGEDEEAVKEWMELSILNGMLGVEYQSDDGTDNDVDHDSDDVEEEEGCFSTPAVESTSRFMMAMLLSALGKHDECLEQLKYFDLTHRLHPRVWEQQIEASLEEGGGTLVTGGVLPKPLYDAMCMTFAPDAVYWKESNYAHRGYHSYYFDVDSEPSNLIEEVVVNHLLPLAKKCQAGTDKIVGAEWWPHHRPIRSNLGHNLHFDTDEALLQQDGIISHPVLSSVLYLTTGGRDPSGSTIILDQTPDSAHVANKCWTCTPQENAYMVFDGSLLHGVLPCPIDRQLDASLIDPNGLNWAKTNEKNVVPYRLTFMVGFWTRSVPERIINRKLYGPCGDLPPADSNEWVRSIAAYPKQVQASPNLKTSPLPAILPAWEAIETKTSETLPIPNGINHRFFVKGAPQCFRDSLFEDRDEEDC